MDSDTKLEIDKLPLNVLLTKRCNAGCSFCVEKTVDDIQDNATPQEFIIDINYMILKNMVSEVLLLGGEPLYYRGILEVIDGLKIAPIITTNGYRLIHDVNFRKEIISRKDKIKAINISIPHHTTIIRNNLMRYDGFDNFQLRDLIGDLRDVGISVRINTVLLKNYIQTLDDVVEMAKFTRLAGATELKLMELTGKDEKIHNFIRSEVLQFNSHSYAAIPDIKMLIQCHKHGGTHLWKEIKGVKVYFNAPPRSAMAGGMDKDGNFYHRVLFNDRKIGFSWNRSDGLTTMSKIISMGI